MEVEGEQGLGRGDLDFPVLLQHYRLFQQDQSPAESRIVSQNPGVLCKLNRGRIVLLIELHNLDLVVPAEPHIVFDRLGGID